MSYPLILIPTEENFIELAPSLFVGAKQESHKYSFCFRLTRLKKHNLDSNLKWQVVIAGSKVKFIQHTHYTLSAHLDHSSNLHKKYSERNSWIFSVSLEKTSNLSRNIGNENANAMCEGEGEIPKCWKSNDRWRKESVEHCMMHFSLTYLGNTQHYIPQ